MAPPYRPANRRRNPSPPTGEDEGPSRSLCENSAKEEHKRREERASLSREKVRERNGIKNERNFSHNLYIGSSESSVRRPMRYCTPHTICSFDFNLLALVASFYDLIRVFWSQSDSSWSIHQGPRPSCIHGPIFFFNSAPPLLLLQPLVVIISFFFPHAFYFIA